jgi:hypothetical protein
VATAEEFCGDFAMASNRVFTLGVPPGNFLLLQLPFLATGVASGVSGLVDFSVEFREDFGVGGRTRGVKWAGSILYCCKIESWTYHVFFVDGARTSFTAICWIFFSS